MGRRSLPKIDPTLDLSVHFRDWDDRPQPFSQKALFGRTASLEVEVGSGKGLFLQAAAAAWPERNFLGIELSYKYARFAAARLAKQERANARLLCADAVTAFAEWLPSEAASAVHIYFPDPWWKKRHRKRRVMTAPFVAQIHRVLLAGGTLHFWTDVQEYFESTLALIGAAGSWEGPFSVSEKAPEHELDFRTHFERRMRLHNLAVYRSEFRKPQSGRTS